MTTDTEPKIYVACLASYVNGYLHGEWIDADQDIDDLQAEIDRILASSPAPDAEEWAVHDYDEMVNLGEYPSLETISEVAKAIAEHGEAYKAYKGDKGSDGSIKDFIDCYQGQYDNEKDFVESRLDEDGTLDNWEKAGINRSYIDFESIATDWFIDSYVFLDGYVFHR